ncbi:CRISPR-associated protein Csx16 [Vibrio breoganii]|uniref:CRISPR-associated protein Csx16 n=1 Tax=Vibrio breoganii TaxID=553239 RepID=A0ABX1U644_9VIBR|nr:CRISPR-associated protein Csx16 [Vibrio breoganii]NMO74617.1 CRISPR-associated protein Csx16 [Vibrio breoganii]NMR69929.1 CRISPR-associated protein Csx16 [Vibrio breoganii]PMG06753.1 putative CRISPR-associated protein [Vibrio breoganii]PML89790.1 putative CRISPR-associated protein [Vibrio breoganii]
MTTYLVTRHPATVDWILQQGIQVDINLEHLACLDQIKAGDVVIGVLPITIVCQLNELGAEYIHFGLNVPREFRGKEISLEDLERFSPRLETFFVQRGN